MRKELMYFQKNKKNQRMQKEGQKSCNTENN